MGVCIPVSTTQYSETGPRICAYLLLGVTLYMITSFGLGMKELERGFGAHITICFSKVH